MELAGGFDFRLERRETGVEFFSVGGLSVVLGSGSGGGEESF